MNRELIMAQNANRGGPGWGRICGSILQTIGDMPIVRLDKFAKQKGLRPSSESKNIVIIIPSFAERYLRLLFEVRKPLCKQELSPQQVFQ
jgi:hypothetical protein